MIGARTAVFVGGPSDGQRRVLRAEEQEYVVVELDPTLTWFTRRASGETVRTTRVIYRPRTIDPGEGAPSVIWVDDELPLDRALALLVAAYTGHSK